MFEDSYLIIILISVLVILSYAYSALAVKTKIPSVLLLLFTGIVARFLFNNTGYELPPLKAVVQFFGIIGVILIVLEGALELKLKRDKLWLIVRSFFSALVILIVSTLSIAYGIKVMYSEFTYYLCIVNALPFAVISSAIAIPSVSGINEEKKEFVMSKQLLRCGTSIGANYREAEFAESKADFIHKLAISQKECNETLYWLELLQTTNFISKEQFESINNDAIEIIKLIIMIFLLVLEKVIKFPSLLKEVESNIPSQAGEKLFMSSAIDIPTSLFLRAPASFSPSPIIKTFSLLSCLFFTTFNLSKGD